jgi:hypothetical protein
MGSITSLLLMSHVAGLVERCICALYLRIHRNACTLNRTVHKTDVPCRPLSRNGRCGIGLNTMCAHSSRMRTPWHAVHAHVFLARAQGIAVPRASRLARAANAVMRRMYCSPRAPPTRHASASLACRARACVSSASAWHSHAHPVLPALDIKACTNTYHRIYGVYY